MEIFGVGIAFSVIMFAIVFIISIVIMVFVFSRIIGTWNKNNKAPKLTVEATVVTKRTSVYGDTATSYYTTFEVQSGDRMELSLTGREYGMLAEGDRGRLSFQGARFISFERF